MMSFLKENQLVVLGVVLATGLVFSSFSVGSAVGKLKANSLNVTGAASTIVKADKAQWTLTATGRAPTEVEAYTQMRKSMTGLQAYLKKNHFTPQEWHEGVVNKSTNYKYDAWGHQTSGVEAYEVTQSLDIETSQVNNTTRLASGIGSLIMDGLSVTGQMPQYLYTKLDDIKITLLGQATENAKKRGVQMAKSTQNSVGPLTSASSGVFQVTPENSTEVSDWGINDTSSVNKKVTAVVNVSFALQ